MRIGKVGVGVAIFNWEAYKNIYLKYLILVRLNIKDLCSRIYFISTGNL